MATYLETTEIPDGLRWDVPRECDGQAVEVAYADALVYIPGTGRRSPSTPATNGADYKRVTDRSVAPGRPGRVTYYRREA